MGWIRQFPERMVLVDQLVLGCLASIIRPRLGLAPLLPGPMHLLTYMKYVSRISLAFTFSSHLLTHPPMKRLRRRSVWHEHPRPGQWLPCPSPAICSPRISLLLSFHHSDLRETYVNDREDYNVNYDNNVATTNKDSTASTTTCIVSQKE